MKIIRRNRTRLPLPLLRLHENITEYSQYIDFKGRKLSNLIRAELHLEKGNVSGEPRYSTQIMVQEIKPESKIK